MGIIHCTPPPPPPPPPPLSLRTQVVILVSSLSNDNVLLSGDKELEELLSQLKSPLIVSIKVGHHEQPKSGRLGSNYIMTLLGMIFFMICCLIYAFCSFVHSN